MTKKQEVMASLIPGRSIVLVATPGASEPFGPHKFLNVLGTIKKVNTVDVIIERNGKNCHLSIPKASEIVAFDGARLEIVNPNMGGTLVYSLA